MDDDPEKKVDDSLEENAPADLDKAFESGDDATTPANLAEPTAFSETPAVPDVPETPITPPTEEPGSDVSPLAVPDTLDTTTPKPFQDVAPASAAGIPKPQDIKVEVSNSFADTKDKKGQPTPQASNVPVFPNADMGAGTVNVFPKKTSAVPAVLATVFAILFVLALAALAWVLYVNNWNYSPKKDDQTSSQTKTTTNNAKDNAVTTTPNTPTNTLKVTELGVQLTNLPSTIADLTYTAQTNADGSVAATLTTPEIKTAVAADSSANPSTCAVGVLTKMMGTYDSSKPLASGTFVAQYSGFYLVFSGEQSDCSTTAATNAIVTSAQNAFTNYIKTPSNITAL